MRSISPEASETIIHPKDLSEELIDLETANIDEEIKKYLDDEMAEVKLINPAITNFSLDEIVYEVEEIISHEETTGLFFTVDEKDDTKGIYIKVNEDGSLETSKGRDITAEKTVQELFGSVKSLNISLWKVTKG